MTLTELLAPWISLPATSRMIYGLHNDSRKIQPGFLFFAYAGSASDGRLYCQQALDNGAVAIIYDPDNWPLKEPLPSVDVGIPFPHLASHLADIASRFYQKPSKQLSVTGVTGTNGKTTIAWQLAQAHDLLADSSAAYIGTLGYGSPMFLKPLANTTPDALCLQHLCHDFLQQGVRQLCMEVSSHALAQHRVDHIDFQQAIFTNLTLDHLDYHQTMAAYAEAKALLFQCQTLTSAIINQDDEYAFLFKQAIPDTCQLLTYGIKNECDVKAISWNSSLNGTVIAVKSPWGEHQLSIKAPGFFNIYNALAIFTSLMTHGYAADEVIEVMARLHSAPGRMDIVAKNPSILVDYAHTPDALENVLMTLNSIKKGRLIVVFGCGGDRDTSKRPIMGEIAARLADVVIITSDNPRSEHPLRIIDDIKQGIALLHSDIYTIAEREQAIQKAIQLANKEDIVLVAGKGHESWQQIGQVRHDFSDQAIIRQFALAT